MANKKYYIRVPNTVVEVSEEIYQEYHKIERYLQTLMEKDMRNGKVSYSDLDTDELLGEEIVPDRVALGVEETVVLKIMSEKLHECLNTLPKHEKEMINAIYFEGLSERQLSAIIGLPQKTINNRKLKILNKLRRMLSR